MKEAETHRVTLLIGGGRSGKSRRALEVANKYGKRGFLATAEAIDAEMEERIAVHKKERGSPFTTVEESTDIARGLTQFPDETEVIIIDCLTVWIGNLMHHFGDGGEYPQIEAFIEAVTNPPCDLVIVTNEVGLGLIPPDPLSRRFRDIAGRVNQKIAEKADEVYMIIAGLSVQLQ